MLPCYITLRRFSRAAAIDAVDISAIDALPIFAVTATAATYAQVP